MRLVLCMCLGLGLTGPAAFAQVFSEVERVARSTSKTAPGRGSEPAPAPWLVSTPTSLFDRPTLQEAFKVSSASTDKGSEYSVTVGPSSFLGYPTWWSEGLQAHLSYNPTAKLLSYGGKWSVSGRDPRLLSATTKRRIEEKRRAVFDPCFGPFAGLGNGEERDKGMAMCQQKELDVILAELNSISTVSWSAAASGQQDFAAHRFGDFRANVSVEYTQAVANPVWSAVLNADTAGSAPNSEHPERAWEWRLGLQGLYHLAAGKVPTELGVGAKFARCFARCLGDKVSVVFGPTISITLAENTQVGGSLVWRGSGGSVAHAFGSLTVSYSFDSPFNL